MKPTRDAAALAASLTTAAAAPLRLPERPVVAPPLLPIEDVKDAAPPHRAERPRESSREPERKTKLLADTVGISLRPSKETLKRYTLAAAERTMKEGRVISAQQLMLEVLETGPKVKK